jgi:UTP-glucose-1-phosphate uridylyltransferase
MKPFKKMVFLVAFLRHSFSPSSKPAEKMLAVVDKHHIKYAAEVGIAVGAQGLIFTPP